MSNIATWITECDSLIGKNHVLKDIEGTSEAWSVSQIFFVNAVSGRN